MNGQRPPIVIAQWCSALGLLIVQYCASTGVAAEAMEPIWSGAMNGGQKIFSPRPFIPFIPPIPLERSVPTGSTPIRLTLAGSQPLAMGYRYHPTLDRSPCSYVRSYARNIGVSHRISDGSMISNTRTSATFSLIPNPFSIIPRLCLSYNFGNLTKMVIGMSKTQNISTTGINRRCTRPRFNHVVKMRMVRPHL